MCCWIAPRDITPGLDWPTAISKAIEASRIMVLVFSTNSNTSNDMSRELILAANNNLIIIPFKIGDIQPESEKQYYLARTHCHIMFISGFIRETHGTLAKVLPYQGVPLEPESS